MSQEMNNNEVSLDPKQKLFVKALEDCDTAQIKKLISSGFYVNQIITDLPPLSLAAIKGRYEVIDLLISSGADVCQLDATGKYTPMFYAIKHKCPQTVIRRLILAGAPKDGIVEYNLRSTALHLAVYANQKSLIKCLLSLSVDVNSKDKHNMTPLHVAVQANHPKIVKMLVSKGAKLDVECSDKFTPLMLAIYEKKPELVELLISLGSDVNYEPEEPKYTYQKPLNYTAGLGQVEIMKILLNHGADPKSTTIFGDSPLHSIAQSTELSDKSVIQDAIRILIEHGGDLNCCNNVGHYPLHSSIISRNKVVTKYLLKIGSNISIRTKNEDTPLHLAAAFSDSAIVKLLLSSGADMTATNSFGLTPYDLALKYGDADTVRVLWRHGQPYDDIKLKPQEEIKEEIQKVIEQQKQFFSAVELGLIDKMASALENGAEPKGRSLSMRHPLHFSVSRDHEEIVHQLLERGVPVGGRDENGETPLHLAAKSGNSGVCFDLLAHGACYNSFTRCGKTPYAVARESNNHEVMKLLGGIEISFSLIENRIGTVASILDSWDLPLPSCVASTLGEGTALGALMNCVNNQGDTILSKAISKGLKEGAQTIMSYRLKKLNVLDNFKD